MVRSYEVERDVRMDIDQAVRVHVKPFVRWIWLGAALMALGGLVTATDRRFRRAHANPAPGSPA
jgi:cytochrome c biogenesis factor